MSFIHGIHPHILTKIRNMSKITIFATLKIYMNERYGTGT